MANNGKSVNITCMIGDFPISLKAIKSLEIERNFTDVSNKFSLVLIDTPQTGLTDLELYMCAGNRTISVAYNDNPEESGFVSFKGQIWDYTSAFVGSIKQLTISGYISRTVTTRDNSGTALYNIDWNNYFCSRVDTRKIWNICDMEFTDNLRHASWLQRNQESYGDDKSKYIMENQNVTMFKGFASRYKNNAITIKIQGPGKAINLPVPESFAPMNTRTVDPETEQVIYEGDEVDSRGRLWGELSVKFMSVRLEDYESLDGEPEYVDTSGYEIQDGVLVNPNVKDENGNPKPVDTSGWDTYWVDKDDNIRAFKLAGESQAYIQLNPTKEYFGAGIFIQSSLGVDPSYIVKQLCDLEGWKYTESSIVQTSMVPCSDSFKMNNQSALQYISEVLAPISITPVGLYKDTSGNEVKVSSGSAGFSCWFDSNDVFHYEPLSNLYSKDRTDIVMGYNIPDSPVISFQVDTKGTCFYTTNAQEINSIYITTGKQVDSVAVTSSEYIDEYNKVAGHNETIDQFFGYTYEQIKDKYDKKDASATNGLYLGYYNNSNGGVTIDTSLDSSEYNESLSTVEGDANDYVTIVSSAVQRNLVTKLASSGVTDAVSLKATLADAATRIEQFPITATLNIWANTKLHPSTLIKITNMVKSKDTNYTEKHPTSGDYLILKQVDKISGSDFQQQLSLIRANATLYDNINPQKIDYSKGVEADMTKTEHEKYMVQKQETLSKAKQTAANSKVIRNAYSLWTEYIKGIIKHHLDWVWWCNPSQANAAKMPDMLEDILGRVQLNTLPRNDASPEGWYTWPMEDLGGLIGPGRPDYNNPDGISLHFQIQAWYDKAKADKDKGELGKWIRHYPQTATASQIAKMTLSLNGNVTPNQYGLYPPGSGNITNPFGQLPTQPNDYFTNRNHGLDVYNKTR